jgi:hypothetical protein
MPKCNQCKTFKKADNCQKCFYELQKNYWVFIDKLFDTCKIIHITTLDKIKEKLKQKKEEIRNFNVGEK